ncbi:MAG: PorT family protein [Flavobacteriales bacterium]|nr:PorT family protein [Flavobacteriales bacterium]
MRQTLTTIAALCATGAMAQLEIRPHVGMNLQNFTEAPTYSEWKSKAGFQVGGDLMFGSKVHFSAGLQYVLGNVGITSTTTNINGEEVTVEGTVSTGSLRVPLRFGYRFVDPEERPAFNFRLFGGLAASLPIVTEFDQDGVRDVKFNDTQLAITAGAGLDISVFFIDVSYDIGMTPVFDDERIDVDPKANMLQVNAGVRLKLAR